MNECGQGAGGGDHESKGERKEMSIRTRRVSPRAKTTAKRAPEEEGRQPVTDDQSAGIPFLGEITTAHARISSKLVGGAATAGTDSAWTGMRRAVASQRPPLCRTAIPGSCLSASPATGQRVGQKQNEPNKSINGSTSLTANALPL